MKNPTDAEINKAQKVIDARSRHMAYRRKRENSKFIGNYFSFRNNDGMIEWRIYIRVDRVAKDGSIWGTTVEIVPPHRDCSGEIGNGGFRAETCHYLNGFVGTWEPTTKEQFYAAMEAAIQILTTPEHA